MAPRLSREARKTRGLGTVAAAALLTLFACRLSPNDAADGPKVQPYTFTSSCVPDTSWRRIEAQGRVRSATDLITFTATSGSLPPGTYLADIAEGVGPTLVQAAVEVTGRAPDVFVLDVAIRGWVSEDPSTCAVMRGSRLVFIEQFELLTAGRR